MFCENCGHENKPGSKFCGQCGTPLTQQQQPPEPQQDLPPEQPQMPETEPELPQTEPTEPDMQEFPEEAQAESPAKSKKTLAYIAGFVVCLIALVSFGGYKYANAKQLEALLPQLDTVMQEMDHLYLDIDNNKQAYDDLVEEVRIQTKKKNGGAIKRLLATAQTLYEKVQADNEHQIAAVQETFSAMEADFASCLTDSFDSEIDALKNDMAGLKKRGSCESALLLLDKANALKAKIDTENKNILVLRLESINAKDNGLAFPEEIKQVDDMKAEYAALVNDSKFMEANETLNALEALIDTINTTYDNYAIAVNQVDFSEFPKIKLFMTIEDTRTGNVPADLLPKFFFISERDAKNPEYIRQRVDKVVQLNEKESLNINLVADCSGSMEGYPIEAARYIMREFLDYVQFGIGDKVELTAFSDYVATRVPFTNSKQDVSNAVYSLQTDSMTALYDALFAAVNTTAVQSGAKCVVAFTDGMDNVSNISVNEVIAQANRYNVPIFIIGIGNDIDEGILSRIALNTNGFYTKISNVSDLGDIYRRIYAKNKEMYMVEYETQNKEDVFSERLVQIDIQTRTSGGTEAYTFTPHLLGSVNLAAYATDPIDRLIGTYLINYVHAINNHDYAYIVDYIAPGGDIERQVKPYIQKNIKEQLLSYEITQKEFIDANTCIVTTLETYIIQNQEEPLHARVLLGKYKAVLQSDGKWRLMDFADTYKILSKTAQ